MRKEEQIYFDTKNHQTVDVNLLFDCLFIQNNPTYNSKCIFHVVFSRA